MLKVANFVSILFHPLLLCFFNFLILLLLTPIRGAVLGFDITLFFLSIAVIPLFYIAAVTYNDNKEFEWKNLTDMKIYSRRKILIYSVIYSLVILLFVLNQNPIFLKAYKPMYAFILMGLTFSLMLSFLLLLLNKNNSMHTLMATFFATFSFLFANGLAAIKMGFDFNPQWFMIIGFANLFVLSLLYWARWFKKEQSHRDIIFGILIGIISPVSLYLLTYGI